MPIKWSSTPLHRVFKRVCLQDAYLHSYIKIEDKLTSVKDNLKRKMPISSL
jgi:hypothetical protein